MINYEDFEGQIICIQSKLFKRNIALLTLSGEKSKIKVEC